MKPGKKTGLVQFLAGPYQKQIVPTANYKPTSECLYLLLSFISLSAPTI